MSLQWLGSLLWHGFDSWPRNFYMPWAQQKTKTNINPKTFGVAEKIWGDGEVCLEWEERAVRNEEGDQGYAGEVPVTSVTSCGEARRTGVTCHC